MTDKPVKRKKLQTSDLFQNVMSKLERIDERLESIETQQTLTLAAWQRQGRLIEEVNTRCLEKLGLGCPLEDNGDEESVDGDGSNHAGLKSEE